MGEWHEVSLCGHLCVNCRGRSRVDARENFMGGLLGQITLSLAFCLPDHFGCLQLK